MKKLLILSGILALLLGASVGCHKTLEAGGAYAPIVTNATTGVAQAMPDMAFYVVDASFMLAYSVVDTVYSMERDNRAALWGLTPAIKHTLDETRPTATEIVTDYFLARRAYIKNPTQPGLVGLQSYLARIQQLSIALKAVLPANTNTPALLTP